MPPLPPSIREFPDEIAASAASRLARANKVPFREFLRDMGISEQGLLQGTDEDLAILAEISGLDLGRLRHSTPFFGRDTSRFRHEAFPPDGVVTRGIRGCPECLLAAPGIKGMWVLPFASICLQHRRPLVELWPGFSTLDAFDVATRLQGTDLISLCAAPIRDPTGFEKWVSNRIDGVADPTFWLNQFDLVSVSRFCAELGRAAIATRIPKWRNLPPEKSCWPFDVGFSLCIGGEVELRRLMSELQGMMGRPDEGPRKIFGGLNDLLAADPCPGGLTAFRALLHSHIMTTWPLAPGDEVLGEPVLRRDRISLSMAARLLGVPQERVLEELTRDGVAVSVEQAADWRIFDIAHVVTTLDRLNTGLDRNAFCDVLSMNSHQVAELQQDGMVVADDYGLFDPLAAQALVDTLLVGAEPVYVAMHDWCSLSEAAKRLKLTLPQLLADIRLGKILRVGKYLQKTGFASVLINLGQEDEEMSMEAFAAGLGLRTSELATFYRRNGLPHRKVKGPRGGAQSRVSAADRHVFLERYISFRSLGVRAGLIWDDLAARLEGEGIAPAGGSARIYERAAVAHILG